MRHSRTIRALLIFVGAVLPAAASHAAGHVWWEGEVPAATNFQRGNPFGPGTLEGNAHLLSGGDWLNMAAKRSTAEPLFARYDVDVPAAGEYALWARKFWKHGPFRWRFDAGEWQTCPADVALADSTPLKKHVSANWVSLGRVKLTAGKHAFELQLLAEQGAQATACFDCFVLSTGPFIPRGKLKPGERSGQADDGYFAYEPAIDPFTADALLDLRHLNEPIAGQSGFLQRKGKDLALGNGQPIRFWAVNVSAENAGQDRASVDYLARKLAKFGVNMVRFHSGIYDNRDVSKIDAKRLDDLHYFVAAMKNQGIYTNISFYFPLWLDGQKAGLGGYDAIQNKKPFALLYFDAKLQEMHRGWMRQILTPVNPYTNTPLAREPAVGMVELINEDSFFFWSFTKRNVPQQHWAALEKLFANWAIKRHGSVAKAQEAWGTRDPADAADRLALYEAWHMTGEGVRGKARRVGDQVRFLAETQRGFYESAKAFLQKDLKFGGLVVTSNWTVADANMTGAIERWTYTAGDVIDMHGYFDPDHKGEAASYSVRVGHTFKDEAAVKNPAGVPLRFQQIDGYPQMISELGFTQPNRYRADGVFLTGAYAGMQGADGVFFFAVASNYLNDTAIGKFQVASPATVAAFPAAALAYRRGDVPEAPPAVHQVLRLDDLFAMKGSGGWSTDALDELRKKDLPPGAQATGAVSSIDELAPYVGPVVRSFGDDPAKSIQRDYSKSIDRNAKRITSLTGGLTWDWGDGVASMNTPHAQGAAGFLGARKSVDADNVVVRLGNDYGTVTVVSLDNQPIQTSRKLLVQVMTQDQPYGFRAENGTIRDLGAAPFGVRKITGSVTLRQLVPVQGENLRVIPLDENGYPATGKKVTAQPQADRSVTIQLLDDVLYYVVMR